MNEEQKQEEKPVVTEKSESTQAEQAPIDSVVTAKPKLSRKKWIIIAIVVMLVFLGIAGGVYGMVYQYRSNTPLRAWLIETLPLPVARVDGEFIALKDYEDNVSAAKYFFDQQEQQETVPIQRPTDEELSENELERMIELVLLQHAAASHGVEVTDEDVQTYFDANILPQANNSMEEVESTLQTLYGWTVDDFKQQVLIPVVLKQKLQESLANDPAIDAEAKSAADAVHQEATTSGTEFSQLAEQYSDDTASAIDGGMLGSFGKGVMVKEFEEAAFALQIGEISAPVKTDYGYHIIKVTDRDDEAGTVEARHILIATKSVDDVVNDLRDTATIRKFLPQYQ